MILIEITSEILIRYQTNNTIQPSFDLVVDSEWSQHLSKNNPLLPEINLPKINSTYSLSFFSYSSLSDKICCLLSVVFFSFW